MVDAMATAVPTLPRAWYSNTTAGFLADSDEQVLGALASRSPFDVTPSQREAWLREISCFRNVLPAAGGHLHLEFTIPRLGGRADAVVQVADRLIVIEFKTGADRVLGPDREQVWDYALDLKNFHAASHCLRIVPVLVVRSGAPCAGDLEWDADGVARPVVCDEPGLEDVLAKCAALAGEAGPGPGWAGAPYRPSPTIIEAARALYAHHRVEDIARAEADNLALATRRLGELAEQARAARRKVIAFVTGVPGAGKTLVGLGLAAPKHGQNAHGVYLSGNGPLVRVLSEALARDECRRTRQSGQRVRLGDARRRAQAFIQNVHRYRDEYFASPAEPPEPIAIFDEAQRAWDQPQLSSWLQRRQNRQGITVSESELLLEYLDRRRDWALVVALVGEDQEINVGEAGIGAWIEAMGRFPQWEVHLSPHVAGAERLAAGRRHFEPDLHLSVSLRSFRSEAVSEFVRAALSGDRPAAKTCRASLDGRFPLVLTRDLDRAKRWLRAQVRGSQRCGLLVSSKAERLRPLAIDVRVATDPVHWFLDAPELLRSSNFLEDAATEFDTQGLELDWTCVVWDGDLRRSGGEWTHHQLRGDGWQRINKAERRAYQLNAYRVLMTRARQGMVLCIPRGEARDATRRPEFYDRTFEYFAGLGVPELH